MERFVAVPLSGIQGSGGGEFEIPGALELSEAGAGLLVMVQSGLEEITVLSSIKLASPAM